MTTRTRSARPRHAAIPIATLASLERSLWDRRDQLSRRVGTIEADLRSAHDRDWQERAGELENEEVLTQLDEMSLAELHQIREALQRIQNGTYGTCSRCGQPIAVERLSAVPTAATCVACTLARRR
jgi:RNA polymerase-binding protein DksA